MMAYRNRRWRVSLLVVAVVLATTVALGSKLISPAPQSAGQSNEVDNALREAAQARFRHGSVHVRLGDGTSIAPLNTEHETQIKVNLFKKLLVQEKLKKDPSFRHAAEQTLVQKRPAEFVIQWDEPQGTEQVRFVSDATVTCALPMHPVFQITVGKLAHHPCLQRESLKARWDSESVALTVEVLMIDSQSKDWPQLLDEEMKDLAAREFVRNQGHTLTASVLFGKKE